MPLNLIVFASKVDGNLVLKMTLVSMSPYSSAPRIPPWFFDIGKPFGTTLVDLTNMSSYFSPSITAETETAKNAVSLI